MGVNSITNISSNIDLLFSGLLNNIIIVVSSAFIPLLCGILFSILVKKSPTFGKVVNWLKIPCESINIITFLFLLYYVISPRLLSGNISVVLIILAMSTAYFWYLPSRYNYGCSFKKNVFYNGLGLLSALFKWSCVASFIGYMDMVRAAGMAVARTYDTSPYTIVFLISFCILANIEIGRTLIKQFMK